VIDAAKASGERFEDDRLLQLVAVNHHLALHDLLASIAAKLKGYSGRSRQTTSHC